MKADPHNIGILPIAARTREETIFGFAYNADDDPAESFKAASILMRDLSEESLGRMRKAAEKLLQWTPMPRKEG